MAATSRATITARARRAASASIPSTPPATIAAKLKYRFQWTAPILISPHDHRVVYHAANVLFKTSDAGRHWTPISPDLTRNDKSKQKWSGGPDHRRQHRRRGLRHHLRHRRIAEAERGVLWAGSDDGLVHVSRDGGKTWSNVTANIMRLPEWGTVRCIEASPFDAGTAYVVVDAHKLDDRRPYLFQTKDFGKTWQKPRSGEACRRSRVICTSSAKIRKRQGLLYLGGERGPVRVVGRRRQLDAAAAESADRGRHRSGRQAQRSGRRHQWPLDLDPRRSDAAASVEAEH